jgi:hypothetical protein
MFDVYISNDYNVVQIYLQMPLYSSQLLRRISNILLAEDTYGERKQYMSVANGHALALAIAIVVVVLLSTVPIGSTFASTKSFSNSGNNIKTETENSKPYHGSLNLYSPAKSHTSLEHSSHCRHNPSSELVNLFRHRLQTLQIVLTCST